MNKKIKYEDFDKNFPELTKTAGVDVGEGWFPLVWELFERLSSSRTARNRPISDEYPLYFSQIKEKYGTLRMYPIGADDEDHKIIQMFEEKSQFVCEQCGESGKIRGTYWLYTACDKHTKDTDLDLERL